MEQFAIGANFKSAAARRNERERFDAFAEFKNFGRQTDGLGRVVSNDAVFDGDFGLHAASSFPTKMVRKSREPVKVRAAQAFNRESPAIGYVLTQALRRQLPLHDRRQSNRKRRRTIPSLAICDLHQTAARYRDGDYGSSST